MQFEMAAPRVETVDLLIFDTAISPAPSMRATSGLVCNVASIWKTT